MNHSKVRSSEQPRAYLVADLGCTYCGGLAQSAGSLSKGRVAVRDVADPSLPYDVRKRLSVRLEPLLYSTSNDEVTIWSGASLRLQLARIVGPSASAKLLAKTLDKPSATGSPDKGTSRGATTRRRLLSTAGVAALGVALGVGVGTGIAAAEPAGQQNQERVDRKAVGLLTASTEWAGAERIANVHHLHCDVNSSNIITSPKGFAALSSTWSNTGNDAAAVVTTSIIDTKASRVAYIRTLEILKGKGEDVQIKVHDPEGLQFSLHLSGKLSGNGDSRSIVVRSPDNLTLFSGEITSDGDLRAHQGYAHIAQGMQSSRGVHPDFLGLNLCEWAVGLLCSAGGGIECYALCAAVAFISVGLGGLPCATACALLGFMGCVSVTNFVCG